jgi:phospholipase/carboxylesterase
MELLYTAHVPPGDGPFPTILALHGWGASSHDLIGLAPILHGGDALVLCPQGPLALEIAPGMLGFGWFPLSTERPPDPEEFREAAGLVRRFLDAAVERYPVDRRKLVILGFSQGGSLAYSLALAQPERFAGLVALSAWLPEELLAATPPGANVDGLQALIIHGTEDPLVPVALGQQSRDRLTKLGVSVSYREHPMEHEIRPEALRDLVEWLERKVFQPIQLV